MASVSDRAPRRPTCRPALPAPRRRPILPADTNGRTAMPETARRIVLARRPQGAPVPDDFRLEEAPVPEPRDGRGAAAHRLAVARPLHARADERRAVLRASRSSIGAVMTGEDGRRGRGERAPRRFGRATWCAATAGWQSHFALPADKLRKLDPDPAPVSTALGVLGMPGMTAYAGLLAIGQPQPGETVVVGGRHRGRRRRRRPDRQAQGLPRGRHRRRRGEMPTTSCASSASTPASITASRTCRAASRRPCPRGSTSTSRMSAARSRTPSCRC